VVKGPRNPTGKDVLRENKLLLKGTGGGIAYLESDEAGSTLGKRKTEGWEPLPVEQGYETLGPSEKGLGGVASRSLWSRMRSDSSIVKRGGTKKTSRESRGLT